MFEQRQRAVGVILVAQNHAPRRHMGVATSTVTFARSIGATVGVAVFGAVFASRLATELTQPGGTAAQLAGGGARLDPEAVRSLPATGNALAEHPAGASA